MEIEDFIVDLPPEERRIVERLRTIILETEPRLKEKLSYGVPYFFSTREFVFCGLFQNYHPGIRLAMEKSLK